MRTDSFPTAPAGSVPPCVFCSAPLNPDTEEDSGFSVGRGARQASCPECGRTTYFDWDKTEVQA